MIAIHKTPFKRNVKNVAETMFTYLLHMQLTRSSKLQFYTNFIQNILQFNIDNKNFLALKEKGFRIFSCYVSLKAFVVLMLCKVHT